MTRFLTVLVLAGCATSGSSVPVEGNDIDVTTLAGQWNGTYEGLESGRKGTVSLDLATGNRVAEGKVVMSAGNPAEAKPLGITFMKMGGRQLNGKIEPYTDPRCSCTVETEFVGTLKGQTISGTFTTKAQNGAFPESHGRWTASRQ
jgi:hypothetical protein